MRRRRTHLAIALLLLLLTAPAASAQDLQTWTDASGKYKTQAEFVRVDGESVVLRKADGKEVTVPLKQLNAASRQQAKSAAEAQGVMDALAPSPRSTPPRRQTRPGGSPTQPPTGLNAGSSGASTYSPSGPPPEVDAKTFVDALWAEYKQTQSPVVFWNALPPSYQSDINGIVQLFGQKYDPALATEIDSLKNRLVALLKSKKQFVLNTTAVPMQPEVKTQLAALYDPVVAAIDAALATDLITPKNLQQVELPQLIEQYGQRVTGPFETLGKKMEELGLADQAGVQIATLEDIEYTIVQNDPLHATMTVKKPDGTEEVEQLVAVEGRWVPEDMARDWSQTMQQAREGLEQLTPQQQQQAAAQIKMMAGQMLAGLEATSTQQEFDEAIGGLMGMAMAMAGGMGGPPGQLGGPGGGFGGPGGGFGPPGGAGPPGGNPEFDEEDFSIPFDQPSEE